MSATNVFGFKKLILWQESKKLVVLVYKLTEDFPRSEEFGLKSQMRRASVSVMSNIAEGWLRKSVKDKLRFFRNSSGLINGTRFASRNLFGD